MFVYDKAQLDIKRKVTLKVNNTPVSYPLNGNKIVLTIKNTQQKSSIKIVEGAITDPNGEPVIGAIVKEEGTNNGVISELDGKFSVKVYPSAHLSVSYVGMITKTISVKGKSFLNITLTKDNKTLEEVVVVRIWHTEVRQLDRCHLYRFQQRAPLLHTCCKAKRQG